MLLTSYRQRNGLSQNALARAIGANPSTINLLEGSARRATREFVLQLAGALQLEPAETDELLVAAHHAPVVFERISPADPDLRIVFDLLTGEGISQQQRHHFRQLLRDAAGLCSRAVEQGNE